MGKKGHFALFLCILLAIIFITSVCTNQFTPSEEELNAANVGLAAPTNTTVLVVNAVVPMRLTLTKPHLIDSVVIDVGESNFTKKVTPRKSDTLYDFSYTYTKPGKKIVTASAYIHSRATPKIASQSLDIGMIPLILNRTIKCSGSSEINTTVTLSVTVLIDKALENSLRFYWFHNMAPITNASQSSYVITKLALSDKGDYHCIASNSWGADTSYIFLLQPTTPLQPPMLLIQPTTVTVTQGNIARFWVCAHGEELRYQWMRNGLFMNDATAQTYELFPTAKADSGSAFLCMVSNPSG
ncbi:MAG: immunoglobulin domain-containing protein, partial [Chitinivibrionales bacterium]|nr:immunoglobulin domain-containing protein [Chitinivibrionales bacterium]